MHVGLAGLEGRILRARGQVWAQGLLVAMQLCGKPVVRFERCQLHTMRNKQIERNARPWSQTLTARVTAQLGLC